MLDAVRGKNILSVGLGGFSDPRPYSFHLHSADLTKTISGRLAAAASTATFVDLSRDALEAFKTKVNASYHELDITSDFKSWPSAIQAQKFDVVILGEVMEHLDNPGAALRNLSQLLTEQGKFIITVPNAFSLSGIVKMFFSVENTHPEHTCHYSYLTAKRLLDMNDLKLVEMSWYRWPKSGKRGVLQFILQSLSGAVSRLLPQFSQGMILVTARQK
ncbi:class I SAM-dependent methyltransferase [Stenotrophobium rhamnosiphilum]|uniref:class I SAM-dependent methyltransferase n=1 Tax=Stenotrophobium rhamnosiphilum TaxID=2029166 RepID=UPI001374A822|nr:class I SAM-dependent methyltransferase [Stenotrophobium rhamnosiphilum]